MTRQKLLDTLIQIKTETDMGNLDNIHNLLDPLMKTVREEHDWESLLKGLIKIGDKESAGGTFRVILDYDNYHDGALVLDGDGKRIADFYGDFGGLLDSEDPQVLVEAQFIRAIEKAVYLRADPDRAKWIQAVGDELGRRFGAKRGNKHLCEIAHGMALDYYDPRTPEGRYEPAEAVDDMLSNA